jgi:cyclopropane-fatty-acyl-phospholipid synthase
MAGVAQVVLSDVTRVLGTPPALRLRAWDGSEAGPPDAPALVLRSRRGLRRLVWQPNDLGFGRAYVSSEVDVDGDIFELVRAVSVAAGAEPQPLPVRERVHLVGDAVRLGLLAPSPPPPPEEVPRQRGPRHSVDRDRRVVSSHYDVGNDFYRLVLGPSMVYSCAYWPESPDATLEEAQRDKLELVCRKLGLRPGMRLLDVGCGWGSLVLHAAAHHGVSAVGITVSAQQQRLARERMQAAGLAERVDVRLQDYRDVRDGPYDAIASVGMAEHVGPERYLDYARCLHSLLAPGGRLLNH